MNRVPHRLQAAHLRLPETETEIETDRQTNKQTNKQTHQYTHRPTHQHDHNHSGWPVTNRDTEAEWGKTDALVVATLAAVRQSGSGCSLNDSRDARPKTHNAPRRSNTATAREEFFAVSESENSEGDAGPKMAALVVEASVFPSVLGNVPEPQILLKMVEVIVVVMPVQMIKSLSGPGLLCRKWQHNGRQCGQS